MKRSETGALAGTDAQAKVGVRPTQKTGDPGSVTPARSISPAATRAS